MPIATFDFSIFTREYFLFESLSFVFLFYFFTTSHGLRAIWGKFRNVRTSQMRVRHGILMPDEFVAALLSA